MKVFSPFTGLSSESRKTCLLLAVILGVGLLLRLYRLGDWSLWCDEMMTVGRIRRPLAATIQTTIPGAFPPLYYILMNLWCRVFGYSEVALRLPSVIFSILGIGFSFALTKDMFGRKTALTTAVFLSLSVYNIHYAQHAKQYAMAWCFGTMSMFFLYRFIREGRRPDLAGYVLAMVLSLYTLYVGFLFLMIHYAVLFIFRLGKAKWRDWLLGQMVIVIAFLPWAGNFFHTAIHRDGIVWIPQVPHYFLHSVNLISWALGINLHRYLVRTSLAGYLSWGWQQIPYVFLFFAAFAMRQDPRTGVRWLISREQGTLLAWIFLPILCLTLIDKFVYPIYVMRYIGFIHIPLFMIISVGLWRLSPKLRILFFAVLAVFFVFCQGAPYYWQQRRIEYQDWRTLLQRIEARRGPRDLIVGNIHEYQDLYYVPEMTVLRRELSPDMLLEKSILDTHPPAIFLIHQFSTFSYFSPPPGYVVVEDYRRDFLGYLWLRREHDSPREGSP